MRWLVNYLLHKWYHFRFWLVGHPGGWHGPSVPCMYPSCCTNYRLNDRKPCKRQWLHKILP